MSFCRFAGGDGSLGATSQSQIATDGSVRTVTSSPLRRTTQIKAGGPDAAFFIPVQHDFTMGNHSMMQQQEEGETLVCSGRDHQRHTSQQDHLPCDASNGDEEEAVAAEHPPNFVNEPIREDDEIWGDNVLSQSIASSSTAQFRPVATRTSHQHGHQPPLQDDHNSSSSGRYERTPWHPTHAYANDYQLLCAPDHIPVGASAVESASFLGMPPQGFAGRDDKRRTTASSNHSAGFLSQQPRDLWQQQNFSLSNEEQYRAQFSSRSDLFQNIHCYPHAARATQAASIGPPPTFLRTHEQTSMAIGAPNMVYQHVMLPPLKPSELIERQLDNKRALESLGLRCAPEEPSHMNADGRAPLSQGLIQGSSHKQNQLGHRFSQAVLHEQILQDDLCSPFIIPMARSTDREKLTVYQFLLRDSLEYFTATQHDVDSRVRGRKQKVRHAQIGVRCRYCSHLKISARGKGAVYYPKSLINVYQAAQNIATAHFNTSTSGYCCRFMPPEIAYEIEIQKPRRDASKAGRAYWVETCQELGIYEDNGSLWVKNKPE